MSVENFKFGKAPSGYPRLILRAYTEKGKFVEWVFTPPADGKCYQIRFETMQTVENDLHVSMFPDTIMPIE